MSQSSKELDPKAPYLQELAKNLLEASGNRCLNKEDIDKQISQTQRYWKDGSLRKEPLEKELALAQTINNGELTFVSAVMIGYPGLKKVKSEDLINGFRFFIDNVEAKDGDSAKIEKLKSIRAELPTLTAQTSQPKSNL